MADIIQHVCAPDTEVGSCYYCGQETNRRCAFCADCRYVCPEDGCTQKHALQARSHPSNVVHLCMALIVTLALISAPVKAQTISSDISASGNQFLDICSSVEVPVDKATANDLRNMGLCQGYMQSFSDGVGVSIALLQHDNPSLASLKGSVEDFGICFPEGVNLLQAIRVTLKYIREHPEQAHLPSATLIFMADLNAFPCTSSMTARPSTQKP